MPNKVLIVDDEPDTVLMLSIYLQNRKYSVVSANGGNEALVLAQVEAPDAILLDMMMPDITGDAVCQKLRSDPATKHIPIIIISARTAQADKDRALTAGANHYLTKPINFSELMNCLKTLIPA